MCEDLGYIDCRLLLTHFRIPWESLDEGLLPLMSDEDVIRLLKYVPRLRELDVHIEIGVSLVERHMMERMMSKGNGVVIEEIIEVHDLNDAIRKEFDSESGNNASTSKLAHLSDGSYDNDFSVFESVNGFPPPRFAKRMNEKKAKRMNDEFEFRNVLAKIDFEFGLENLKVEQDNDVDWKHDPRHLADEPKEIIDLFDKLDQVIDELDRAIDERDQAIKG
ncbi:hypothetical protein Tco_0634529 [Tanacetum coccineum]